MRVDHRGLDILVAEQFLNGPDIVSVLQQMRGKGMAKRMAACLLRNAGVAYGRLHDALDGRFMEMVTPDLF